VKTLEETSVFFFEEGQPEKEEKSPSQCMPPVFLFHRSSCASFVIFFDCSSQHTSVAFHFRAVRATLPALLKIFFRSACTVSFFRGSPNGRSLLDFPKDSKN